MDWKRYAIYWLPSGDLGDLGAAWLGWDARRGYAIDRPVVKGLKAGRYGFHATLKPPFRLAWGATEADLRRAANELFAAQGAAALSLAIGNMGRFIALRPTRTDGIARIAAAAVQELDRFRAPAGDEEMKRRRAAGLTPRQEELLTALGYPYVLDEFHPHLTLSDLDPEGSLMQRAGTHFAGIPGREITLDRVSLVGEDANGYFHLIEDFALGDPSSPQSSADNAADTDA